MNSLYEVLGIKKGATREEIRKAYLAKSKETHPDKGGDAAAFRQVKDAYDYLTRNYRDPSPPRKKWSPPKRKPPPTSSFYEKYSSPPRSYGFKRTESPPEPRSSSPPSEYFGMRPPRRPGRY